MIYRSFFILYLLLVAAGSFAQQRQDSGFSVIELFVSEGCGASPAAEKSIHTLLEEYSVKTRPVYLLTFHVDYWNKYGWKDPYSSLAFTRRQNNYASALKQEEVFTPQVFINGQSVFAGEETRKIKTEIERMLKAAVKNTLTVKTDSIMRDTLWISYTSTQANANVTLAVFLIQPKGGSKVLKGDNEGRMLVHKNIVRKMDFFSVLNKTGSASIPLRQLKNLKGFYLLAYLQQKQTKNIIAVSHPVLQF
jgi:hypothetical protein